MIAGSALRSWLSDPARQEQSVDAVQAAGQDLEADPAVSALEQELASLVNPRAEDVLAAADRFVGDGANAERCLARLAEAAIGDPFFRPPLRNGSSQAHDALVIFERPFLSILIGIVAPDGLAAKRTEAKGTGSISFAGQRSFYRFPRSGGATLSFWEAPLCRPDFAYATAGECRLVDRRPIADGETVEIDGVSQSFVVDHLRSAMIFVQAATPLGASPLTREYDGKTLRFVGASSADINASRMGMIVSLLREMDRRDAAPLLAELLREPHFYARWHIMRELLALDAELALPHLRLMAMEDSHPELRAAAAEALSTCFAAEDVVVREFEPCPA